MKIDINLSENDIQHILRSTNYTEESVTLWYEKYIGPYDQYDGMDCVIKRIAYPVGQRPKELDSVEPLLEKLTPHLIENVVPKLFNQVVLYGYGHSYIV
jgi:hypothetical protein